MRLGPHAAKWGYLLIAIVALFAGASVAGWALVTLVIVLAALNLAHELLDLRSRTETGSNALARQIDRLKSKLDAGLPPAP